MKKLILLPLLALLLVVSVSAQTKEAEMRKANKSVKKELKSDWKDDSGKYSKSVKKDEKALKKDERMTEKHLRKELRVLEGTEVGSVSKHSFAADFPDIQFISSERLDNYDEFTFMKDGITKSAFYDSNGKLVGTTEVKKYSDLPMNAQQKVKELYKEYIPTEVLMFDSNEDNDVDMILYGNQFPSRDSYFVELVNGSKKIAVRISLDGESVEYFTRLH